VIHLPDGRLVVIDVGPRGCPLVEWLREGTRRGVQIAAVVLTHNDADHAGAMPSFVAENKHRIGGVWMLVDRRTSETSFQKIFRAALDGERDGHYAIRTLTAGQSIWSDQDRNLDLRVVHPGFSTNVLASNPNETSGVIVLDHRGRNLITWPGDLELRATAQVLRSGHPEILIGPHHGGPSDYPSKSVRRKLSASAMSARMLELREAASSLRPDVNFISVGTRNPHHHPRPGILNLMARQGTRVICSQLTDCCDRQQVLERTPVFEGAGALGLRASKTGVSCRGALRVYIQNGLIQLDEFSNHHIKRIARLQRPQCFKGRGWKAGDPVPW
jgi:beta-lactamase superfamily II metal-dependent hydrolase